jgi:hypothetical protein
MHICSLFGINSIDYNVKQQKLHYDFNELFL